MEEFQETVINVGLITLIIEIFIVTTTLIVILPTSTKTDIKHLVGYWSVITCPLTLFTTILFVMVYYGVPWIYRRRQEREIAKIDIFYY